MIAITLSNSVSAFRSGTTGVAAIGGPFINKIWTDSTTWDDTTTWTD